MVQLSHPYMTTGKIIALTVSKVMSLLFNMLSKFVMGFLPRSKQLLISLLLLITLFLLSALRTKLFHLIHCTTLWGWGNLQLKELSLREASELSRSLSLNDRKKIWSQVCLIPLATSQKVTDVLTRELALPSSCYITKRDRKFSPENSLSLSLSNSHPPTIEGTARRQLCKPGSELWHLDLDYEP